MAFRFDFRVYVEDTDMGGIVYYVNYLKFFERARSELLRSVNVQQYQLQQEGLLFVVHDVQCRYHKSACLDDELIVEVDIKQLSGARMVFVQRAYRKSDSALLCSAEIVVVSVSAQTMRPIRLPMALYEKIKDFAI